MRFSMSPISAPLHFSIETKLQTLFLHPTFFCIKFAETEKKKQWKKQKEELKIKLN